MIATFKEVVKKIQIKFKILDLAVKENERINLRNKVNELVEQQTAFEKRLDEINNLKVAAEEFMLKDDESLGEVENWVKNITKSTKLRVVYDASIKSESGFSLNDCLEKGPPLQNKLWHILIRTRFRSVVLCGDIEKAFLQIRIRENERDCLRFHWSKKVNYDVIKIYRFTRLVFGLNQSPFVLEGILKIHFENYFGMFREMIERVKDDIYVDDLVTGGESTSEVDKIKGDSVNLFQRGGFKLHKWHSNEQAPETNDSVNENKLNFAKKHLGTKLKETKIVGLLWDKREDFFIIQVLHVNKNRTKRNILSTLASFYDLPITHLDLCRHI